MQEIFRRAHNNKRQYFIEPLNASVFDVVSVQSTRLTTDVV